jgi:magnesium transporter
MNATSVGSAPVADNPSSIEELSAAVLRLGQREAVELLMSRDDSDVVAVLERINPARAQQLLTRINPQRRQHVIAAAPPATRAQWMVNQAYKSGTVGSMMDPPIGVFRKDDTVATAVEQLRTLVKKAFITYGFVVDDDNRLIGVLVMRDMLLADAKTRLDDLMIREPFVLEPSMAVMDAMKVVLNKHFPVYPVCDDGQLVGLVRGQNLFEQQAIEISAQAGSMVGVDKEERLATPWPRSLKFRHPWLQLNLLTAFIAAAVVGVFQGTIDRIVVLAVFLPVLAGQSGNTGCQALAVALRAMTLGEMKNGKGRVAVIKEAILGLTNGMLVGLTAGLGMYFVAFAQKVDRPLMLAAIVFISMTGACVISGVSGVLVPIVLKRLGADPATASSIFLTTATDVASMGLFLGLASVLM